MPRLTATTVEDLNRQIQEHLADHLPYGHPFVDGSNVCLNMVPPECLAVDPGAIFWQDEGYKIKFHEVFTYTIQTVTEETQFLTTKIASPLFHFNGECHVAVLQESRDTRIVCHLFSAICSTFPFYP